MADSYYRAGYTGSDYSKIYMELHVYTVATDLQNLKTTERADLYMVVNDASSQWWNEQGTSKASITVNSHSTGDRTANFNAKSTGVKALISTWDTEVTHNSSGVATINVSASHNTSIGLGTATLSNQTYTCDTLDVTPTFTTNPSITTKTETSVTVDRGATNISSNFYWSTNNSTWTKFTSAETEIANLSPNTNYTIYIQARNAKNESYKSTKTLSVTTYAVPTQSVSSKTENKITMSWSADSTIKSVGYSLNGNLVIVGTVSATSGTYTITGLTPNTTYNIRTYLVRSANNTQTETTATSVKTYSVPIQSLNSKTETSIRMNWSVDSTADYIWYSKDNGSTWTAVGSVNATSGRYTISGLTAGTTYNIRTRVRRKATQTTYDTTSLSVKTYTLPTQSVYDTTETTITMNWGIDSAADKLYYSTDGGSNWSNAITVSGTSGRYTISGLNANTAYDVLLKLHRVATDTNVQPSSYDSIKTYDYPYCIESPNFTISDSGVTLKFYNPLNRTFTFKVIANGTQLAYTWTQNGGTSHLCFDGETTQNQLYASIPNQQSATYQVKVTYGTSVKIRNNGNTFKIKGTEKPTFSNFTYADTDSRTTSLTGNNQVIVNGYSDIQVTISSANKATGNYSASISKYRVTIGSISKEVSYSSSEDVTVNFTNQTSQIISVTAIDSRGLETTVSKTVNFKDYRRRVITNAMVERENGVGTKVYFNLKGTYWNGNFGSADNEIRGVYYRWKEQGGTLSSLINITDYVTAENGEFENNSNAFLPASDNSNVPFVFELGKTYEIYIAVIDSLIDAYWTEATLILDSGIPCTDKYKDDDGNYHIGINQLAEDDVALAITDGLKVDGEKITDGVIVSVSEPSTKEKVWLQHSKNIFNAYDGKITYIARNSNESYTINGSNKLTITNSTSWGRITLRINGLKPSTKYTMSSNVTNSSNHNVGLYTEYNGNNVRSMSSNSSFKSSITFTTDSYGVIEVSLFANWSGTVLSETVIYDNIQLEIGTLATSYETYVEPKTYIRNDNGIYEEYIPANETYSKNEIRIGTWKDGKPLYRKVYESGVLTASETIIDATEGKSIKMIEGWLFNDNGFCQPYGSYQNDTTRTSRVFSDGTYIKVQQQTAWQNNNIKARVIIKYTKSTD